MHPENLYSAVYSGVPVYEFINPKSSVMRRKKDGWINATHILKVADFPKARRTRILEKDVQIGTHEKVQGGYGKYQGTWVPMDKAQKLAVEFNVLDELKPLFDYRSSGGADSPPPAPKHHHASNPNKISKAAQKKNNNYVNKHNGIVSPTPTKASQTKKSAATSDSKPVTNTRKRKLKADEAVGANQLQQQQQQSHQALAPINASSSNTYLQSLKAPQEDEVSDDDSDDFDDDSDDQLLKQRQSQQQQQQHHHHHQQLQNNQMLQQHQQLHQLQQLQQQQQRVQSRIPYNTPLHLQNQIPNQQLLHANLIGNNLYLPQYQQNNHLQSQQLQQVQSNVNDSSLSSDFMSDSDLDHALQKKKKMINIYKTPNGDSGMNKPLIDDNISIDDINKIYTQKLLEYFLSTGDGITINNDITIPDFITNPTLSSSSPSLPSIFDLNQVIDKDGNTTFHWACAMGDLKMCDSLLTRNCNFRSLNNQGQVPIMRSVMYTNSYTRRTFAKLLDLLSDTILDSDSHDMTILHHIAMATISSSNLPSARYYTEILLTKIAEIVTPIERIINFINHQDSQGNTAFHIFANNDAIKCIKVLLGYNARVDIPNNKNEYVSDYLYKHNAHLNENQNLSQPPQHSLYDNNTLIMKPFNPNLEPSYSQSQLTSPMSHSIKSPSILGANSIYQNHQHHRHPTHHQPMLSYYSSMNYLNTPHYSESAMQVNQRSNEILEKLDDLSNSFDVELLNKNNDLLELQNILKQMDVDILKYRKGIDEIVDLTIGRTSSPSSDDIKSEKAKVSNSQETTEPPTEKASDPKDANKEEKTEVVTETQADDVELELTQDDQAEKIQNEFNKIEELYFERTDTLRKLIERSQAKDLATIVSDKETEKINKESSNEDKLTPSKLNLESITKILSLVNLQLIRSKTVDELVTIYADASENTEIINNYRKLVSKLSNVPYFEVDESLNDIEECLKLDLKE